MAQSLPLNVLNKSIKFACYFDLGVCFNVELCFYKQNLNTTKSCKILILILILIVTIYMAFWPYDISSKYAIYGIFGIYVYIAWDKNTLFNYKFP